MKTAEEVVEEFHAAQARLAQRLRQADVDHAQKQVAEAEACVSQVAAKLSKARAVLAKLMRDAQAA